MGFGSAKRIGINLQYMAYPLTHIISNGIGAGFILFTLIELLSGKGKEVHWLMYIVSLGFAVDFMMPVLKMVFNSNATAQPLLAPIARLSTMPTYFQTRT